MELKAGAFNPVYDPIFDCTQDLSQGGIYKILGWFMYISSQGNIGGKGVEKQNFKIGNIGIPLQPEKFKMYDTMRYHASLFRNHKALKFLSTQVMF